MMNIIAWIIVGLIGGALAKLLMPGKDPGGILLTILRESLVPYWADFCQSL